MADVSAKNGSENFYSIEAPGVIRSNTKYNVAVSILQAKEPCSIRLNLTEGTYSEEKSIEVQPMTTELITFDIPELKASNCFFKATGEGALNFNDKINLNVAESKPLIYIQLDKQSYKRGDKVDFRVFFLDNNIRPAEISQPIKITIEQTADNIAAEFANIELTTGVYTGQWTIPEDISSGIYVLEVHVGELAITRTNFEILDFKDPKFNIVIKGSRKVRYANEFVNLGIEASYPDGAPVKGRCTVHVKSIAGYFGVVERPIEKYMDIDGTVENIIFSIADDFNIDDSFNTEKYFHTALLSLDVTVVDAINNTTETLTEILTIIKNDDIAAEVGCGTGSCGGWRCVYPLEVTTPLKQIVIKTLNETPKLGELLSFDVILNKPTNYFVYVFTARGNIIKSELVSLDEDSSKHTISINATFELVPRAFVLAYYVFEGELFFDEIGFDFEREFENKLSVKAPSTIEAGKEITIEINTDPKSLVGVMAIDINSKLPEYKNDIDSNDIFEALHKIRSQTPWLDGYGEYPGMMSGLVTFTNAIWQGFEKDDPKGWMQNMSDREHMNFVNEKRHFDLHRSKKEVQRKMLERNQVFGNLMFFNKETDDNGNLTITETLPDISTTWLLTAFAMHPSTGFTMTKSPLEIEAKSVNEIVNDQDGAEIDITQKPITKTFEFEADLYEQSELTNTFEFEFPENTEPLSVEFTIARNLLGPIVAEIAKYPTTMYCTGMLHMTTLLPNVAVLEFLQCQNQLDSELAKNIIAKFDEAITRELSERQDDGSFAWFISDKEGSPHVTAVVIRAFQRVSKFADVDPKVIKEGLDYLVTRQTENGDFVREAEPYKIPFQPELSVGLTATILLAFIQDKENIPSYQNTIDSAVDYIISNISTTRCGYDLALAFYALQKLQHPFAVELKERLLSTAHQDENKNQKWWGYSENINTDADYYAPISDLEVTSYVLLGLLETESIESVVPIVKWLLPYGENLAKYRPESMDCAISLDAVLNFAVKSDASSGVTNIEFTAFGEDDYYMGTVHIEPSNANIIKTNMLPNTTKKICYSTKDKGSFKGNVTYRYTEN